MDQQPQQPNSQPEFIDVTAEPVDGNFGSGSYSHLDRVLNRRRNIFFGILILLSLGSALWLLTRPRVFEATSSVLLTRIGPDARPVSEGELASEIQLVWAQLQSLTERTRAPGAVSESYQSAEARKDQIRAQTAVRQQAKSQVISISYTDPSQRLAIDRANQLTELYLSQRRLLFSTPIHLVGVEAEAATLLTQADDTAKELAAFDAKARSPLLPESLRIKSQRLSNLEDRAFEIKASVKGQEEVLRVLRKQGSAEQLQAEAQLAGMRAKLQEMEKEFARLEKLETQTGTLTAKREELARRAALARERVEFVTRRLQDSRVAGMNLQARVLTRAEAVPVHAIDLEWWQILLLGLGVFVISWLGAWAADLFDRPIYSDDEFARMAGAPKVRTAGR